MTVVLEAPTPLGPGRLHVDPSGEPRATLLLGHGAGGGVGAMDLELLARRLPLLGVTVVRFEQPWRTAGRRVAVRPPQLDVGWRAAVELLRDSGATTDRLFVGGRSAGARVACRTADELDVAGVVCLAFPLHLPGTPERSRLAELLAPSAPRLVLQGSRDAFGSTAELVAALQVATPQHDTAERAEDDGEEGEGEKGPTETVPGVRVVALPGADHSFRLAAGSAFTPADLRASVVAEVAAFVLARPSRPAPQA